MDSEGRKISEYNADLYMSRGLYLYELEIAKNEDLIGVYGSKDNTDYFTRFGFIVKVLPK